MTKGQLLSYHTQIRTLEQQGHIIIYLLRSRIQDFYKEYGLRINNIFSTVQKINEKYYKHEEKEGKLVAVLDEEKFILNEGFTEEDRNKEMQELLSQPVNNIITTAR